MLILGLVKLVRFLGLLLRFEDLSQYSLLEVLGWYTRGCKAVQHDEWKCILSIIASVIGLDAPDSNIDAVSSSSFSYVLLALSENKKNK